MGQTSLCGIKKKGSFAKSISDLSLSPVLEFMVDMRNVKIITSLETYFYILTFGNFPNKLVGDSKKQNSTSNKEELNFKYMASFEELKNQFILIQLLENSHSPQVVAHQKIPLSQVVGGPTHYDYKLEPPIHRIIFELVMSQIINLYFNATEMLFELDELPDKRVCQPSLRLMVF